MLLRYFLNDFEMVPAVHIITGITFVFTFHTRCICIVRSSHFRIISASCLIILPSAEIATSVNTQVPFSLSRIMMSDLSLAMVLSVCTCGFHKMVGCLTFKTFFYLLSNTSLYQCSLSNFAPVSLHNVIFFFLVEVIPSCLSIRIQTLYAQSKTTHDVTMFINDNRFWSY